MSFELVDYAASLYSVTLPEKGDRLLCPFLWFVVFTFTRVAVDRAVCPLFRRAHLAKSARCAYLANVIPSPVE